MDTDRLHQNRAINSEDDSVGAHVIPRFERLALT